jgi:hypothetical protein
MVHETILLRNKVVLFKEELAVMRTILILGYQYARHYEGV